MKTCHSSRCLRPATGWRGLLGWGARGPPRPTPPLPAGSAVRAGASSPLPGPLLRLSVAVSSAAGTELPGPHPAFNPMRLDVPGTASRLSEAARVDPCPHVPKCVFLSSWFQAGG